MRDCRIDGWCWGLSDFLTGFIVSNHFGLWILWCCCAALWQHHQQDVCHLSICPDIYKQNHSVSNGRTCGFLMMHAWTKPLHWLWSVFQYVAVLSCAISWVEWLNMHSTWWQCSLQQADSCLGPLGTSLMYRMIDRPNMYWFISQRRQFSLVLLQCMTGMDGISWLMMPGVRGHAEWVCRMVTIW
jgi:hypothetical protein